jgi:protein tyrosine phosphatase (PTP) superfamily phosphohydrolase (DUF442 family)
MLKELKNYYKISEMLHTSAQPTIDQFSRIKDSDIEIIINLAEINSPDAIENEAEIVYKNSMDYIHIPVDFEKPSDDELKSFFNIMAQQSSKNILVHCAYNWRVSCFVYLYRVLKQDVLEEIAKKDMLNVWQPNETWESFIINSIQMRQEK